MGWYLKVLKHYADFGGRARRKEYWYFILINYLVNIGIVLVSVLLGGMSQNPSMTLAVVILTLYNLVVFIPATAVGVRRLRDTNRSGWWLLISAIPLVGAIILIIFFVDDSQPGSNEYGTNPKGINLAVEG